MDKHVPLLYYFCALTIRNLVYIIEEKNVAQKYTHRSCGKSIQNPGEYETTKANNVMR